MISYMIRHRGPCAPHGRGARPGGAARRSRCSSTDEILAVTDPDIINPTDVQSAAGANAVRLGALARLNQATSGRTPRYESLFLLGGLFADEWNNGDSFIARQEIDQRVITIQNNFLTDANRVLHRARLSAAAWRSICCDEFNPTGPAASSRRCISCRRTSRTSSPSTTATGSCSAPSRTARGLRRPDHGHRDVDSRRSRTPTRASRSSPERPPADVESATRSSRQGSHPAEPEPPGRRGDGGERRADELPVPDAALGDDDQTQNQVWNLNNNARRYSVSTGEGTNGLNFATANDPRLPICQGGDAVCRTIGVTQTTRDDLTQPLYVQRIWTVRESAGDDHRRHRSAADRGRSAARGRASRGVADDAEHGADDGHRPGAAHRCRQPKPRAWTSCSGSARSGCSRPATAPATCAADSAVQPRREHGLPDRRVAQGRELRRRRDDPAAAGRAEQPEPADVGVDLHRSDGVVVRLYVTETKPPAT